MKKTGQIVLGLIILVIQAVVLYFDRFIVAFLPWLSIKSVSKSINNKECIRNASWRVSMFLVFYFIYQLLF